MKKNVIWLLPVIILSIPILHRCYFVINMIRLADENPSNPFFRYFLDRTRYDWFANILTIVFLLEMLAYYMVRNRIVKKWPVIIYAISSFIAFILFPTLHDTGILLLSQKWIETTWTETVLLFLLPIVIGHILFIFTIVKSFKRKKEIHETPGFLDEFVS